MGGLVALHPQAAGEQGVRKCGNLGIEKIVCENQHQFLFLLGKNNFYEAQMPFYLKTIMIMLFVGNCSGHTPEAQFEEKHYSAGEFNPVCSNLV